MMNIVHKKVTMSRIFIGDKVKLNSGGPDMLVVDRRQSYVTCAYENYSGMHESEFDVRCLTIIAPTTSV